MVIGVDDRPSVASYTGKKTAVVDIKTPMRTNFERRTATPGSAGE
jgi:hypothetical protein